LAVEEPDRGFGDRPRRLVVLERDRPAVETGVRVGRGVGAQLDDRATEVLAGHVELVHVPDGVERHRARASALLLGTAGELTDFLGRQLEAGAG
jgi:hypothetical protein